MSGRGRADDPCERKVARLDGAGTDREKALAEIDAFCDAVPRKRARAEQHGPLVLFVTAGPGWPYYARPVQGAREPITAGHVRAVRARQRELGVPQSFEWIDQNAPEFAGAAAAAWLEVASHPLMILDGPVHRTAPPAGASVRAVPADDPDLARIVAVPDVAFGYPGTSTGAAGAAERDKLADNRDPASITRMRELLAAGHSVLAAAFGDEGPLAAGSCQSVGGVAEITGVGTLPSARRRGLGAAVTAELAALAAGGGAHTVFLSASDDAVARVYAGLGFRRIGTAMIAEPG
jgi:ribosomal protein S18 acetylase RimI-like enzyme